MRSLAFNFDPPNLELRPGTIGAMTLTASCGMMASGLWLARIGDEHQRSGRIVYGMDMPPTWREVFAEDGERRMRRLASWARARVGRLLGRRPRVTTGLLVRALRVGRVEHMVIGQPAPAEMFGIDGDAFAPPFRWFVREGERVYLELHNNSKKTVRVTATLAGTQWIDIAPTNDCDPTIRKILDDQAALILRLRGKS